MKISKVTDYAALTSRFFTTILMMTSYFELYIMHYIKIIIMACIIWLSSCLYSPRARNRFSIKWMRLKGLKVCSYVEKCAKLKNQTLKKLAGTQKCHAQRNTPGVCNISKKR